VDYLLKPVSFDRLRVAILRARRRIAMRQAESQAEELSAIVAALREDAANLCQPDDNAYDAGIWVPSRQGAIRVDVQSIDWIEAARDYVLLNTPTRSHILRAKISDLECRIDPRIMIRVHRSHMVRLQAVTGIERPGKGVLRLLLADGANLQVGPTFQKQVLDALKL
jgi:two-component system, LytTR family, response regulator